MTADRAATAVPPHTAWTVTPEPYDSPTARSLWRAYYTEVADRYYLLHQGRRGTPEEIERGVGEDDGAELAHPTGALLVARRGGEVAGCAGLRVLAPGTAELTRVYVRPDARGTGAAGALLRAAETAARELGARRVRLDTRLDLVEAVALYRRHGFREIPAYRHGPYSEIWFEKRLA